MGYCFTDLQILYQFLVAIVFGIIIGVFGYYLVQKRRIHEFLSLVHPASIYCAYYFRKMRNTLQFNENEIAHHGIIIAYDGKLRSKLSIYCDGIDILINSFNNPKQPQFFKVYFCTSLDCVKDTIENYEKITHLWIFGHGIRHGISIGEQVLFYCDLKPMERKQFIGQYHCNGLGGKSLADYNNPLKSDVTNGMRSIGGNREDVSKKLVEMGIEPISLPRYMLNTFFSRIRNITSKEISK